MEILPCIHGNSEAWSREKVCAMSSPFIYWISCLLLLQQITTSTGLKQHNRTTQNFVGQKPRSYRAKIKLLGGLHSFWRLWGRICFIVLVQLLEAAYIPWLLAPCRLQSQWWWWSLSHVVSLWYWLSCFSLSLIRTVMITLGPPG